MCDARLSHVQFARRERIVKGAVLRIRLRRRSLNWLAERDIRNVTRAPDTWRWSMDVTTLVGYLFASLGEKRADIGVHFQHAAVVPTSATSAERNGRLAIVRSGTKRNSWPQRTGLSTGTSGALKSVNNAGPTWSPI